MQKTLPTENKEWGFWGATNNILENQNKTEELWNVASTLISEIAGFARHEVRALLDSRGGRHLADEFYSEIANGSFVDVFKKAKTKNDLYQSYNYYVDETAYKVKPNHKELFCKELAALSKKYSIVIKSVGGVNLNSAGFLRYDDDLESGDLIPIWED